MTYDDWKTKEPDYMTECICNYIDVGPGDVREPNFACPRHGADDEAGELFVAQMLDPAEEDPMPNDRDGYEPAISDFVSIRSRIRETHEDAMRKVDEAEAAFIRAADAQLATVQPIEMPALAEAVRAIVALVPALGDEVYRLSLDGFGRGMFDALVEQGATVRRSIHKYESGHATMFETAVIGKVEAIATRPATAEEVAEVEDKMRVNEGGGAFRVASL